MLCLCVVLDACTTGSQDVFVCCGVCRYHRMMVSRVKPLHAKVEQTTQAIDNAEHKMMILENKRKVSAMHNERHH